MIRFSYVQANTLFVDWMGVDFSMPAAPARGRHHAPHGMFPSRSQVRAYVGTKKGDKRKRVQYRIGKSQCACCVRCIQ